MTHPKRCTYRNQVVSTDRDTGHTSPEDDLEDAKVQARARQALVDRAGVSLEDALALRDSVAKYVLVFC